MVQNHKGSILIGIRGKNGGEPMPSNQRADSKNSNNPSQKAAVDNRSNQMKPNHSPSKSRKEKIKNSFHFFHCASIPERTTDRTNPVPGHL
jgi:hypothetical protein